jgi:hypothetical protein
MPAPSRPVLASALGAVLLIVAACSSDEGGLSDEEQAYADAFAADFADEDDGIGVDEEEADCMSAAIMEEVGIEPFEEAEVSPRDLAGDETPGQLLGDGAITEEQALDIYAAWGDCADIPAAFAAGAQEQFDADDDAVACLEDGLREGDALEQYMVESFTAGDEPDPSSPGLGALITLITECTASEGGTGGALVQSIAQSLSEAGQLTPEQSQCVAQSVVDAIGAEALLQAGVSESFESASPELQQQVVQALTEAAEACEVPLAQLGGG